MFPCQCGKKFTFQTNLTRHQKQSCSLKSNASPPPVKKIKTTTYCSACQLDIPSKGYTAHLKSNNHKLKSLVPFEDVEIIRTGFKNRICSYKITNKEAYGISDFFLNVKDKIVNLIDRQILPIQFNAELFANFSKINDIEEIKSFNSRYAVITESS